MIVQIGNVLHTPIPKPRGIVPAQALQTYEDCKRQSFEVPRTRDSRYIYTWNFVCMFPSHKVHGIYGI